MLGPANYSVLMVDDNAAMREAIARSLTRRGCSVTTAVSGVDGFEALRTQPFDVIISDLNMPERGGLWLWRQAVALRPELRGRFVIVASEPFPEPRSMSLLLESERFLLKPITLDLLWRQVEDVMRAARTAETGGGAGRRDRPSRGAGPAT
jgi:CheY-like chemotaxis protein